jgi:hypothetical protein
MAPLGLRSEIQNAITDRASILGSLMFLRDVTQRLVFLVGTPDTPTKLKSSPRFVVYMSQI